MCLQNPSTLTRRTSRNGGCAGAAVERSGESCNNRSSDHFKASVIDGTAVVKAREEKVTQVAARAEVKEQRAAVRGRGGEGQG